MTIWKQTIGAFGTTINKAKNKVMVVSREEILTNGEPLGCNVTSSSGSWQQKI